MALIKCSECGREVSDKAPACPGCGAPVTAAAPTFPLPLPLPLPLPTAAAAHVAAGPAPSPRAKSRIRPFTLILFVALAAAGWFAFKVINQGESIRSAVAGPQTIYSEQASLSEGSTKPYGLTLPASRRVEVEITASRAVNVMLMSEPEWNKYAKAKGKLFGGEYTYRQALSNQSVLHMKKSEVLPAGTWIIAVERPEESLFNSKAATVTVKVLAY